MVEIPGLKISGPLGKGGTATVSKAFSQELNKEVALKCPLVENDANKSQFQKLARREFELIGKINFPGIVKVLKHSDSPPYLLLELCHGKTLDEVGKIESVIKLLNIVSAAAASLEFIRLNGLVHGDIKPHNIFLPSDFESIKDSKLFFAKISDFSLGRLVDEQELNRAGHGTIGYAAPETMSQGQSSHRSDLFALGIIAYQLATGTHPFMQNETDPVKIESNIQEGIPTTLSEIRAALPEGFSELVDSLLEKDAVSRPASGWEVCLKLQEIGATYPFKKALSPHFFLRVATDFEDFVEQFLNLTDKQTNWLKTITDSSVDHLRLILTANFRKNNLHFENGKFSFESNIYWPSYLRRKPLNFFAGADLKTKKLLLKSAVIGSKVSAAKFGNSFDKIVTETPPGTPEIFGQLISTATVKRFAKIYAAGFEKQKEFYIAAKLYLDAGLLDGAIKCAENSAKELTTKAERNSAIQLVNRIFEYAEMKGREFDARQLLMIKGDIERTSGDTDSASGTYNQIINMYDSKEPDILLAETYRDFGDLYKTKQDFEQGIRVLTKSIEIYDTLHDDLEMSRALNNIGELYRIASDLPNALKNLRKALAIQKRLNSVADAANSLNNIAIVFGTKGQLKRAITILTISLKMKRTVGNQGEIARALNNLGLAHHLSGDDEKSQSYLKESLALNREIGSRREIFSNLLNLSETMMKSGNLREAIVYVKEGLEIAEALNLQPHMAHMLRNMGNIYFKMNRFSETAKCYEKSLKIEKDINDQILKIKLLLGKSELRFEIGDTANSVSMAEKALELSVTLNAELEEFQSLLILVKSIGKTEHLDRAREIVDDLKLKREKILLEFAFLQFQLDSENLSDTDSHFTLIGEEIESMQNDIEYPEILNTLAEFQIVKGNSDKALALLSESRRTAQSKNLVSEEINVHILEGKIQFGQGNYENAFSSYKAALQLCKQSAMTIESDEDKTKLMKKPKMVFLANQIRELNEKIGQKKKAGV